MKRRKVFGRAILIAGIVVIAAAAVIFGVMKKRNGTVESEFQLADLVKGNIENTVSSTGTINAIGTVEVGTQVSGTIAKLYVDFNDRVRAKQLLAVLDTVPLRASVLDAEANVKRSEAQLEKALSDYNRNKPLFEKGLVAEADFVTMRTNVPTQEAALQSSRAALERARFNFENAYIRSPISGTVIERTVEKGQTVAASFNTPKLFLIAEDLSRLEIYALVDESDIGQIREGLPVRFEVPAYPDKTFKGSVKQIRLQPSVVQNVVNYTVVVDAMNEGNMLLPGMTATVDFIVEERTDVLLVPNAAMQFQATPEMQEEARRQMQKRFESLPDSVKARFAARGGRGGAPGQGGGGGFGGGGAAGAQGMNMSAGLPEDMARIWYINAEGKPSMAVFRKGATDGKNTEVLRSRDLEAGLKVILGYAPDNPDKKKVQSGQQFRPPRMF